MPEIDLGLTVEKQATPKTCWASVFASVVNQNADEMHQVTQAHLVEKYKHLAVQDGDRKGQMDIKKVFAERKMVCAESDIAMGADKDAQAGALEFITKTLSVGAPVICALTTQDGNHLPKQDGGGIPWRHMVLVTGIDADNNITYQDPARDKDRSRKVPIGEFLTGHHYMGVDELGPKASAILKKDFLAIRARAYKFMAL